MTPLSHPFSWLKTLSTSPFLCQLLVFLPHPGVPPVCVPEYHYIPQNIGPRYEHGPIEGPALQGPVTPISQTQDHMYMLRQILGLSVLGSLFLFSQTTLDV